MKRITIACLGAGLLSASASTALASRGDDPELLAPRGPFVAYIQGGIGAPTGVYGLTVGYEFAPNFAVETGFGLGLTGWQIPLMVRWYTPLLANAGPRGRSLSAFSLALGPSVGLISKSLNLNVPHDADKVVDENALYGVAWLNVEVAWEIRASWGGSLRFAIGGGPRIYDNMSDLCSPAVRNPDGTVDISDCDPPHFTSGPRIANSPFLLYFNFGFGWEFGR